MCRTCIIVEGGIQIYTMIFVEWWIQIYTRILYFPLLHRVTCKNFVPKCIYVFPPYKWMYTNTEENCIALY